MLCELPGGTGVIGRALTSSLKSVGHKVTVVTRNSRSGDDLSWDTIKRVGLPNETEVIINLCGRNIGEVNPLFLLKGPHDQYIKELFSSRVDTTKSLVKLSESLNLKAFVNASAIGFYKPDLNKNFTESSPYEDHDFITRLVKEWEDAAQISSRKDVRQIQLRIGVVLSKDSNFIRSIYPSHRLGFGGPIGSGRQWISWIHLDDLVRIIQFVIDPKVKFDNGPVNCTAPNAVRQSALSKAISEAIGAPRYPFGPFSTPEFVCKILLGSDRATLLVDGQCVIPKKLLNAGFQFRYSQVEDVLENIFGRRPKTISNN